MKCPLCSFSSTDFFLRSNDRDYQFCSRCRLVFAPSRFFLPQDEEVGRYLEHQNSLESEGYVDMFRQKIEVIAKLCPQVKTVLDYGCGYEPVLTTLLKKEGYDAKGYDPNFFPQPVSNSRYDMVISTETFEHFKRPEKEIKTILKALSKKGYLAVMTRFYPEKNGGPDHDLFMDWYYQRDPTHICFYSPQTFAWIAGKNACKILYNNEKDFIILQKLNDPEGQGT